MADMQHDEMANAVAAALANEMPTTRTMITGTREALARNIEKLRKQKSLVARRIADAKAETRQIDATIVALELAASSLAETEG